MLSNHQTAQTGKRKSVKLTPDEHAKLPHYGGEFDTQEQRAAKLGVPRVTYLRILKTGSGRGDHIQKIKRKLASFRLPE